jgi:hypothetical protein
MIPRRAASVLALALVLGCEHEDGHVPHWLFQGEWIDVDGQDREADETCAGTFLYLDGYAGVIATEFDVEAHLGTYHWYSQEAYASEDPCGGSAGCGWHDEAYTPNVPHEHELIHMANFAALGDYCPGVLAEGLAEYFDTFGQDVIAEDFDRLDARFADPVKIFPGEYAVAGRFAAFLVHEFGLAAVLEVCAATGRYPDADTLASAMTEILGASPEQLVATVAAEPADCNRFDRYQSHAYACSDAAAAPSAGIVEAEGEFVATYALGCVSASTLGPLSGDIWIVEQIEFAAADTYAISTSPPVEIVLARCGYCGEVERFRSDVGPTYDVEAGRYWLELRVPADFSETVELSITHAG